MLFTVDIGNTTVAIAGLEGERVAFVKKLPSDPGLNWPAALRQLLEGVEAQGAVLSSVVPALTGPVGEGLKAITGKPVLVVDKTTPTGLDLSGYDTANLGMDRVVDCVAALAMYTPPVAVFDMGTATTLSVVDRGGLFRGGMILPGAGGPVRPGRPAAPHHPVPAGGAAGDGYSVLYEVRRPVWGRRGHRGHCEAAGGGAGRADGGAHRRQQHSGASPAGYPHGLGAPSDLSGAGGDLETEYKKSKGINKIKFQQE